jgi:hypothetical protein
MDEREREEVGDEFPMRVEVDVDDWSGLREPEDERE